MKTLVAAAVGLVAPPILMLSGVAVITATTTGSAASVVGSVAACVYSSPRTDAITATLTELTNTPVTADHWDRYAYLIGVDPTQTRYVRSTGTQRASLLTAAVRNITYTETPASILTVPIVWWNGAMPTDNDDDRWQHQPVTGWNGDLENYIAAYVEEYAHQLDDDHTCVPATVGTCPQPIDIDSILATIRQLESGGRYTESSRSLSSGAEPGSGYPTGAYQFLATSWNKFSGYNEAHLAPPAIQDTRATQDVTRILERFADPSWVPVAWYVGLGGAQQIADGTRDPNIVPNAEHNTSSVTEYQARWMEHYTSIQLPLHGIEPVNCPEGAAAVIAWAETQLGAPYAAISPYRFGTPWPGGTLTGFRGDNYTFPAGTIAYDCSGFVVADYRAIGIDLAGQYGLTGSQQFPHSPLPEIPRHAIEPGDIATYTPVNGVGHIVIIHHIEPGGTVYTIEASTSRGVTIRPINWARVSSIKRVPDTTI